MKINPKGNDKPSKTVTPVARDGTVRLQRESKPSSLKTVESKKVKMDVLDIGFLVGIVVAVFVFGSGFYHIVKGYQVIGKANDNYAQAQVYYNRVVNESPKRTIAHKKEELLNATAKGTELAEAERVFSKGFFDQSLLKNESFASQYKHASAVVAKCLPKEFITNPWLRNPDWSLKMETVVNFSTADAPIIFTMKNGNGDLMGIVTCRYDGKQFLDVSLKYTESGAKDAVVQNAG